MANSSVLVERNSVSNGEFILAPLNSNEYKLIPEVFCKNKDLDEFFYKDAEIYDKQLLCKTYKFTATTAPNNIIGLVGLSNDSIGFETDKQKRIVSHKKRHLRSFPAVKIVRLGILKELQKKGLGHLMIDFIKYFFLYENRTACKFITLDAYPDAIKFYENEKFEAVNIKGGGNKDSDKGIRSMFFDLETIKKI